VTVTATEFKFKLSRTAVPTGTVTFTVVNRGKISHDFKILGKKTPTIAPGGSANVTVSFPKTGKFGFLCTLAGHAAAGMKGTLPVVKTVTPVSVAATEFKFKLSRATVPAGTVVFTVTNRGKVAHDFKIFGKKTPTIAPGKSAKLTVSVSTKGRYGFLCTLRGHATAGMKGNLTVASPSTPPTTTSPPITTTPPPTTVAPPTGPVGTAQTTVRVSMLDYRFEFTPPPPVPSGQVTFIITNNGGDPHNVDISGVKSGTILGPGQTETWTVSLPPKQYVIVCDVPFHVDRGMQSSFVVTP